MTNVSVNLCERGSSRENKQPPQNKTYRDLHWKEEYLHTQKEQYPRERREPSYPTKECGIRLPIIQFANSLQTGTVCKHPPEPDFSQTNSLQTVCKQALFANTRRSRIFRKQTQTNTNKQVFANSLQTVNKHPTLKKYAAISLPVCRASAATEIRWLVGEFPCP